MDETKEAVDPVGASFLAICDILAKTPGVGDPAVRAAIDAVRKQWMPAPAEPPQE